MIILIIIYFIVNSFQAGVYFEEYFDANDSRKRVIGVTITSFILVFVWIPLVLCIWLWVILEKFIFKPLQLRFWFEWWFADTYVNLTDKQKRNIETAVKYRNKNNVSDRIYRYVAKMILEKNKKKT